MGEMSASLAVLTLKETEKEDAGLSPVHTQYCAKGESAEYIGESSRSLYLRSFEHWKALDARKPDNVSRNHCMEVHGGQ